MSLRYSSHIKNLFLPAFILGLTAGTAYSAQPPVQTYISDAVPVEAPASEVFQDQPLAAGTLSLKDVLKAYPRKSFNPPTFPDASGMMMSEGMKAVLQGVGTTSPQTLAAPATVQAQQAPSASAPTPLISKDVALTPVNVPNSTQLAQATDSAPAPTPAPIAPPGQAPKKAAATQADPAPVVDGVTYQPGREPKNLAATAPLTQAAPTEAKAGPDECTKNVQKWEKSCAEVGYPTTFNGKITGETRTGCDGALHDVWITNTCAPPEAAAAPAAKINGTCGAAQDKDFEKTPAIDLCSKGTPSVVSGEGPWTWVCSGLNGGEEAQCSARKHIEDTNGVCGSASGVETATAPASGLCSTGAASDVFGDGPWTWTCSGTGAGKSASCSAPKKVEHSTDKSAPLFGPISALAAADTAIPEAALETAPPPETKVAAAVTETKATEEASSAIVEQKMAEALSEENGPLCGSAAETLAYEAPEKDLCREGVASSVNGDGPWTWSCTNNEAAASSCKTMSLKSEADEKAAQKKEPVAEAAVPAPKDDANENFLKPPAEAAAPKSAATPLACGTASGLVATKAPKADLCEGGKASAVRGSNPWHWTCNKSKKKVACATVKPINAACGPADAVAVKAAPSKNLCKKGTPTAIDGDGPWTWTCQGGNGGVSVGCTAPVINKPAASTPAPTSEAAPAPQQDSNLVTPKLNTPDASTLRAETTPVPTPAKSFASAPEPSEVPQAAKIAGDAAPQTTPNVQDSKPLEPPAFNKKLPTSPVFTQPSGIVSSAKAEGPLVLDPTASTILFTHGSTSIDENVIVTLDKLASILQKNADARITLIAYADSTGLTPREARRISLSRALAVRDYLSSKGISESRVDVRAEGANAPSGYPDRVDVKVND